MVRGLWGECGEFRVEVKVWYKMEVAYTTATTKVRCSIGVTHALTLEFCRYGTPYNEITDVFSLPFSSSRQTDREETKHELLPTNENEKRKRIL